MLVDECAVHRQRLRSPCHDARAALELAAQGCIPDEVRHGIMAARKNPESKVERHPARLGERAAVVEHHHAAGFEQLDLMMQAIGNGHVAAVIPERSLTPARVVVQDDEVADRLVAAAHQAVVFLRELRLEPAVGEELDQPADAGLDQVDARGLERLEETAGETERHAIVLPDLTPLSGGEFEQSRRPERCPIEVGEQCPGSLVLIEVAAAEDVSVARAVLQRDPPLPSRSVSDRARKRSRRTEASAGQRQRAIAGKPPRPVIEARVERALDEERSEAAAVDEEVATHRALTLEENSLDEAVMGA